MPGFSFLSLSVYVRLAICAGSTKPLAEGKGSVGRALDLG